LFPDRSLTAASETFPKPMATKLGAALQARCAAKLAARARRDVAASTTLPAAGDLFVLLSINDALDGFAVKAPRGRGPRRDIELLRCGEGAGSEARSGAATADWVSATARALYSAIKCD